MDTHFIVGMSRAGTRWVAQCLNEHPDAVAFGETCYWGRKYVEPARDGRYTPRQLARALATLKTPPLATLSRDDAGPSRPGEIKRVTGAEYPALADAAFAGLRDRPTPAEVFLQLSRALGEAEQKSVVIEKTPHHLLSIDRIAQALPEARFLVLVRRPYPFMLSYKHRGDTDTESARRVFERLYHPAVCAYVWRGYARAAFDAREKYPERVKLVHFEELTNNSHRVFGEIQEFFGLAPVDLASRVPAVNSSFARQRPELSAEDVFWMNVIAGKEFELVGAKKMEHRAGSFQIAGSFFRLLPWTCVNVSDLAGRLMTPRHLRRWMTSMFAGAH